MTMLANAVSFSVVGDQKISAADLAYFEDRLRNRLYDIVMDEFEKTKEGTGLTQASLARRLGKRPEQINRWLSTPGNWTIETISNLLIGINGTELMLGTQNVSYISGMTIEGTTASFGNTHSVMSVGSPANNATQLSVTPYVQPFLSAARSE